MYTIRLSNCAFYAAHGVLDEEQRLGQRFYVDATLTVEAGDALANDRIEGTVHYGEVFQLIEEIVTSRRFDLIEALAYTIGQTLSERFPQIRRAEITVRKPSAPIQGLLDHVEVTVAWPE